MFHSNTVSLSTKSREGLDFVSFWYSNFIPKKRKNKRKVILDKAVDNLAALS